MNKIVYEIDPNIDMKEELLEEEYLDKEFLEDEDFKYIEEEVVPEKENLTNIDTNIDMKEEMLEEEYLDEEFLEDEYFKYPIKEDVVPEKQNRSNIDTNTEKVKISSNTRYFKEMIQTIVEEKPPKVVKKLLPYEVTDNLVCPLCQEVFPDERAYHMHMNIHFPYHLCPICGCSFATQRRYVRHMVSHDRGIYTCRDCGDVFNLKNTLISHRKRKHSLLKVNKCTFCNERFDAYHKRMRHMAKVHNFSKREYICEFCDKLFLLPGNLTSHVNRSHLKIKKYVCTYCKAGFVQKQDLEGHLSTHTGERNYICHVCSKSYTCRKTLRVHIKTVHVGESL